MYICILKKLPIIRDGKKIYTKEGEEPIDLENFDFMTWSHRIYIIETSNKILSYKIKIDDEFILINEYLTITENIYTNNYCFMSDDDFCCNGVVKIKNFENKIIIFEKEHISFKGSSKYGIPHGICEIYFCGNCKEYSCGDLTFIGKYKYGISYGQGTSYYGNGNKRHEGEYINDHYCGKGTLYYENGNKKYEGDWDNDCFCDEGTLYYENGNKQYEGYWYNDMRDGRGTSYYKNGNKQYEGDWENDIRVCDGTSYYENGNKQYEGYWENDKRNDGTSYYENGNIEYKGKWKDDKPFISSK